jgi:predicted transcriptional regulator
MANSHSGNLWITLQTHVNVVAVATMTHLSGIIIVNGRSPDSETLKKASSERIPLLLTKKSAFEVAGKLYQILHAQNVQG